MKKAMGALLGMVVLVTGQLAVAPAASANDGVQAAIQNCTQTSWNDRFVFSNYCMAPGQFITTGWLGAVAPQTKYDVEFQTDGNLVLYRYVQGQAGRTALWHTNTWGRRPYRAIMQSDGNFVLYDLYGNAYWHTDTWRCPDAVGNPAAFEVQPDTNVVLYQRTSSGSYVARWDRLGYAPRC